MKRLLGAATTFVTLALVVEAAMGQAYQQVEAVCAAAIARNGVIQAVLDDLRWGRLSEADRIAEYLLGSTLSSVETNCLLTVRSTIPLIEADRERQATEKRAEEAKRVAQEAEARRQAAPTVQIGSVTCAPQASGDGTADATVANMLSAYRNNQLDDAKASANAVLIHHRQSVTDSQIDCASKVVAAIREQQDQFAQKPDNKLKAVYLGFIAMQACFESRKEFRVQYVSQREMNTARIVTKRDEQTLLQKYPALAKQKDSLWGQAKVEYGKSDLAGGLALSGTSHNSYVGQLCRFTAMLFTTDQQQQQQQIKKDF